MKQRRVVCAAVLYADNRLILGPRHFDPTMHAQWDAIIYANYAGLIDEQGFIDQHGVFMNRQEAWKVAEAAGQILYRCGGDTYNGGTLYSENLY